MANKTDDNNVILSQVGRGMDCIDDESNITAVVDNILYHAANPVAAELFVHTLIYLAKCQRLYRDDEATCDGTVFPVTGCCCCC